jgi:phage repressor protein C with HTH and peptisase S24 domain
MGDSMAPTLVPGMVVLAIRTRKVKPGDVVIFWHEGLDKIKRVHDVQFNKVFLAGDNPARSTDSRDFGWLSLDTILAKVLWPRAR